MSGSPFEAFASALEPEVRAGLDALDDAMRKALTVELDRIVADAKTCWPSVQLDASVFVAHAAERLGTELSPLEQLRALHATDLYLACGCRHGDRRAYAAFEEHFGPDITRAIRKVGSRQHAPEDLAQRVREKLFVGDGQRAPKIAAYRGQGSLRAWVRVTSVRAILDVVRWGEDSKRRVEMESDMLAALPDDEASPELVAFRREHAARLPAAMREAFDSLTARQRNLLRHRFLHGMSTEQVAKMYGVHRATAFRWLEAARVHLFEQTREIMIRELSMSGRELESFIGALRSRLDVSMNGLLPSELEQE